VKCAPICKDQSCRYWQKMPPEFEARYGNCVLRVANEGPKTLEFIAQIFGITRERVRQIEATALRKAARRIREMGLAECERAVVEEDPVFLERASNLERSIKRKRANEEKEPTNVEGAKPVEKPIRDKRAIVTEATDDLERIVLKSKTARKREKPVEPEQANFFEKPSKEERASNKEKPFREKCYTRPMPHEFLLVTEEEILLARE